MLSTNVVGQSDLLDLQDLPIESNYFSYSRCRWREDTVDNKYYLLKKMKKQDNNTDKQNATRMINTQFNTLKRIRAKRPAFLNTVAYYMEQDMLLLGVVTELCQHGNVLDFTLALSAKRQTLSPWIVSHWLLEIAEGFKHLHEYERPPICHGSFSSKHILITDGLVAKIGGFDCATSLPQPASQAQLLLDDRRAYGLACFEALALASPRRGSRRDRVANLLTAQIEERWPADLSYLTHANSAIELVASAVGGEQPPADRPTFGRAVEAWTGCLTAADTAAGCRLVDSELQRLTDFLREGARKPEQMDTDSAVVVQAPTAATAAAAASTVSAINLAKLQLPPHQLTTGAQLSRLCCCSAVQQACQPLLLLLGMPPDDLARLRSRGSAKRQQTAGLLFEGLQLLRPLTVQQLVSAMQSIGCHQGITALCGAQ